MKQVLTLLASLVALSPSAACWGETTNQSVIAGHELSSLKVELLEETINEDLLAIAQLEEDLTALRRGLVAACIQEARHRKNSEERITLLQGMNAYLRTEYEKKKGN